VISFILDDEMGDLENTGDDDNEGISKKDKKKDEKGEFSGSNGNDAGKEKVTETTME
jgi:hypothetical protein